MGDYYPVGRYFPGRSDFERLGCDPAAMPAAATANSRGRTLHCQSRRRFVIRLDRRLVSARVTVNGRRARVLRGRRLRAVIDLRALARQ